MAPYPSSPEAAHALLDRLALSLADPELRQGARQELEALVLLAEGKDEGAPLRFEEVEVAVGERQERLRLLLLPSIPAPSEADFVLLEGVLRLPPEVLEGRRLLVIGSASGWTCLVLARRTELASVVGVDPDPRAAALAACNLWLNCDEALAARISFPDSDLLRVSPGEVRWDLIVADRTRTFEEGAEAPASPPDEEGILGMESLARFLDEGPQRLVPDGRLVVLCPAWPGTAVLTRIFGRRGLDARVLASRRLPLTNEAEIRRLADLEAERDAGFELYLSRHGTEPVPARTALGWVAAGRSAWQEVQAWEVRPRHPRETRALRHALRDAGGERLLARLDLGAATRTRLAHAAALARRLADHPTLPRTAEGGDRGLRERLRRLLARAFGLELAETAIFAAPDRARLLHALLFALCDPGEAVLVAQGAHRAYGPAIEKAGVRLVVAPDDLDEARRLLEVFAVRAVVLSASPRDRARIEAVVSLADVAAERGAWVVLLATEPLDLAQAEAGRPLLERLGKEAVPPNLLVLDAMVAQKVHPDHEFAFLLPTPDRLFADLGVAAAIVDLQIPAPASWSFEALLAERLAGRVGGADPRQLPRMDPAPDLPRSRRIAQAAEAPAFAPRFFRDDDPRLLRLDFEDNVDRIPFALLEGLLAGALQPVEPVPELTEAVAAFLEDTRGVRFAADEIVVGPGVRSLLHDLVLALGRRLDRTPRAFVEAPCPGRTPPTLRAAGAVVRVAALEALWEDDPPDAIVLAQPGPAGRFLEAETLRQLAAYAMEHGCFVVCDESAGLLALDRPKAGTVPSPLCAEPRLVARAVILGGLDQEFAAPGLGLAWAALRDPALRAALGSVGPARPHGLAVYAAAHLYAAWMRHPDGHAAHPIRRAGLDAYLECLRRSLSTNRDLLAAAFGPGAPKGEPGGIGLAPDVSAWMGRRLEGEVLTPENLPRLIHRHGGVVVHGGGWCGDPRRIHAAHVGPRERIEEAARRIRAFVEALEVDARAAR